jgi:dCTP deaminase
MSVLSAQSIRRLFSVSHPGYGLPNSLFNETNHIVEEWYGVIEPWSERGVAHGMSYGLSAAGYDLRIKDSLTLPPGGFCLATTVERVAIPNHILTVVRDKSSWARRGLQLFNTQFEPGWHGYPTIELRNQGGDALIILAGMPICQMVFHLLDEPTESPYVGKYQDQAQVPTPARDEAPAGGWRDPGPWGRRGQGNNGGILP